MIEPEEPVSRRIRISDLRWRGTFVSPGCHGDQRGDASIRASLALCHSNCRRSTLCHLCRHVRRCGSADPRRNETADDEQPAATV